jgi:drug/metabolite transporter (DMT)-like permease
MPALVVVFGRAVITALFFAVALRADPRRARWGTAVAYALMIVTFVMATKATTAANAVFLQYTGSTYVLVLAPWLLREPVRKIDVAGVLLCLGGMALLLLGETDAANQRGNLLGALSGVFFALTLVQLRRDARSGDVVASTMLGNVLAALIALPFAAGDLDEAWSLNGILVLLYLGVVQMGLAYALFVRGLRTLDASTAGLLAMLEPVLNPVWVFLGTGERPGPAALVGGGVVLAMVAARTTLGGARSKAHG